LLVISAQFILLCFCPIILCGVIELFIVV